MKGPSLKECSEKIKAGDFAGALASIREAFKADPDDVKILLMVGLCNFRLGGLDASEKAYLKCTKSSQSSLQAWLGLASVYDKKGAVQEQLSALEHASELLEDTNPEKLHSVMRERAHLLERLERYSEACILFAQLDDEKKPLDLSLVRERIVCIEKRQQEMEQKAVKAAAIANSGFTPKQAAVREQEIHAATVLPPDLLSCFKRFLGQPVVDVAGAEVRCRCISALFETTSTLQHLEWMWKLLQDAVQQPAALESEEDRRWMEIVVLLSASDNLPLTLDQRATVRQRLVERFPLRTLSLLIKSLSTKKTEEINPLLLREPRFLDGWISLIECYKVMSAWRYVEVGVTKATDQMNVLTSRTKLTCKRVSAVLASFKAASLLGLGGVEGKNDAAALAEYELALSLDASNDSARIGAASLLRKAKQFEKALALMAQVNTSSDESLLLHAILLYETGNKDEARKILTQAEAATPTFGPFHFWLGKCLWDTDKQEAQRQFLLSVKCNPMHGETYAWLGRYFAEVANDPDRAKRSHAKAFDLDRSLVDSAKYVSDALLHTAKTEEELMAASRMSALVLESAPLCKWAAQRLGLFLLSQRKGAQALEAFQKVIRADAEDPIGWEGLGDAYREQGKYMAALQAYDRAVALDAKRFYPHYRAGSVLNFIGASAEALGRLMKADSLRPRFVPILVETVQAYLSFSDKERRRGMVEAARSLLEKGMVVAEELSQKHDIHKPLVDVAFALARLTHYVPEVQRRYAQLAKDTATKLPESSARSLDLAVCEWLLNPRNIDDISRLLQHALLSGSVRSDVFNSLLSAGSILCQNNKMALAHRLLLEAVKMDDRSSKPLLYVAMVYIFGGRFALAQRAYAKAVAIDLDLPEAWAGQAVINELLGGSTRLHEAHMLYASVSSMRADIQAANMGLGRTALICGDPFQAELGLRRALSLDPTNVDAKYMLALSLERQKRLHQAHRLLCDVHAALVERASHPQVQEPVPVVWNDQTLVLKQGHGWSSDRKIRAVVAALLRVCVALKMSEEALKWFAQCNAPFSSQEYTLAGEANFHLNKVDEAVKLFERAHDAANPDQVAVVLELLCKLLAKAGRFDQAFEHARKLAMVGKPEVLAALGIKSKRLDVTMEAVAADWHDNACLQMLWKSRAEVLSGKPELAWVSVQKALFLDPNNKAAWNALAQLSVNSSNHVMHKMISTGSSIDEPLLAHAVSAAGKYQGKSSRQVLQDVRLLLQRRVFLEPDNNAAWRSLAWAEYSFASLTNDMEAWQRAKQALSGMPQDECEVACDLSECMLHLHDVEGAERVLAKAPPQHPLVLRSQARIDLARGKPKDALKKYAASVKLDPSLTQCWIEMSEIFIWARKFDAAEDCLRSIQQQTLPVSLRLINVLMAARKDNEAKELSSKVQSDIDREHFAGNFVMGSLALRLGAHKPAAQRLERALEIDPTSPVARELLAQCVMKEKEVERAKELLEAETRLDGGNVLPSLRALGRIDAANARLYVQRSLHLDPSQNMLWKELAKQ